MAQDIRYLRPEDAPAKKTSKWASFIPFLLSMAYGISPIDLIPDIIPLLGWSDDVLVIVAGVLMTVKLLLNRYKARRAIR